jgi:predicted ATPase
LEIVESLNMWVKKVDLINFRSYENGSIELSQGINLIVGQNNAGKSVFLRSVAWLQNGSSISAQDVRKGEESGFVKLTLENSRKYFRFISESTITIAVELSKGRISFSGFDGVCPQINLDGVRSDYDSNSFTNNYPYRIPDREPSNFIYPYLSKRKVTEFNEVINSQTATSVAGNFRNLSAKVDTLCNSTIPEHNEFIESCNEIIGFQLSAVASSGGKKVAQAISAHESIGLAEMGEGVANLLGLIVDLCVANDKLFLIEEPENDIHPKALKKLLELIEKKSSTNQFIITTHSNIVVRHLGSLPESKLFQVTMQRNESRIPVSKAKEVESHPEARRAVLDDLGYDLFDFNIWSGWLFLEESSAERVIRDYLIPWFVPGLKNRLKTFSTQGKDQVKAKFNDFCRLFLFVHLEPVYVNSAWVIIDSGEEEAKIINDLQGKFKSSWDSSHFRQFSEHDFESYYPAAFRENNQALLDDISKCRNPKEKMKKKEKLIENLISWIKEDKEKSKEGFEQSAKEVIDILKEIDASLNRPC